MIRPPMITIPPPTTPGTKVVPRTREVIAYDHDPEKPGKPLKLLVPGGLIAVGAFLAMLFVGYRAWYQREMDTTLAVWLLLLLGVVWFGSIFLFSYGYTLYDTGKAVKMTLLIGIVGVLVVAIAIALFVVFRDDAGGGGGGGGGGKSGSSSSEGGGLLDRIDRMDDRPDIFGSDEGPGPPQQDPNDAGNVGAQPALLTVPCPGCGANRPAGSTEPCAICGTVLPGV
jgi:hypothetical protein